MSELFFQPITADGASPSRWLFYLHGIYGAGRNWKGVATEVARRRPGWGGVLVDLRLHGDSTGFEPPHTLAACARDVLGLAAAGRAPGPPRALLGHSFGGKVALALLREGPSAVRQAWIVDSTPAASRRQGDAVRMLRAVREHPGPFDQRNDAIRALETDGFEPFVASWMATNLVSGGDGLAWRFDPDAIEALLADFFATDLWEVVEAPPRGVELHFVKAGESEVLDRKAGQRIEAAGRETGRVWLHRVAGGHWVNAENPGALLELLTAGLPG